MVSAIRATRGCMKAIPRGKVPENESIITRNMPGEQSMRLPLSWLTVPICYLAFAGSGVASPTESATKCPISLDRLDLRYNHAGGVSVPQLKLAFANRTDKTITDMLLNLSILDPEGNPHPYSDDLTYHRDIPPGPQPRSHTWTLDAASVDMHHAGESVTLQQVQFADGTTWKDDGSLACTLSVDFHAK